MEQKPLKTKVSITIDDDILQKTKKLAEKDDRNLSQYINLLLRDNISKHDKSIH